MFLFPFSLLFWVAGEVGEMAERERQRAKIEAWRSALARALREEGEHESWYPGEGERPGRGH